MVKKKALKHRAFIAFLQCTSSTTGSEGTTGDQKQPSDDEGDNENEDGNPSDPEEPEDPEEPLVLKREESYLPTTILNKMMGLFEETQTGGTKYWNGGAPYSLKDRESFKGKTLASISLAVYGTTTATDGDFIFTLQIFKDTPEAIANSSPLRTYKIKVFAKEYGLTENATDIYKLIKVDLTDYGITVGDDEIMAFDDVNDTLILAYADGSNPISKLFQKDFPKMIGFSMKIGKSAWAPSAASALIYNFTFAEQYDNKDLIRNILKSIIKVAT